MDYRTNRLQHIAAKVQITRQYYDTHEPVADEVLGRAHLEELEFLLEEITRLKKMFSNPIKVWDD